MPLLNNRTHSLMIKITRICSPDVRMGQDEKERGHYLLKFVASVFGAIVTAVAVLRKHSVRVRSAI